MPKRRVFDRPLGEQRYRKLFVIAVEGAKTEHQYFAVFNNEKSVILVKCLKSKHDSAPPQVLKRMTDYLKREALKESDEAWLVVDKDQWTDEQLTQLHQWSQTDTNHGFALSNPNFEYWLLLHFEDGTRITGSKNCSDRLKRYLPDYDKNIDTRKITRERIDIAIRRARQRDNPPCVDWPRAVGSTTAYKLVVNILRVD
jgi:uncharacterized protein YpiB (UPF0302 family)